MDPIHELYADGTYPAMSHPLSDPAVSAVAARLYGLRTPLPATARILEIGCSSGHNLLPLAMRWPDARFTGIDLSPQSIDEAKQRANACSIDNASFEVADLRTFEPADGPFDFIIAHGFFSWVPDDAKMALLDFCHRHLATNGIATISFNLACGWERRLPVIEKVRAIQVATGADIMSALAAMSGLTDLPPGEHEVIADMMAKGPGILSFDDFGPVNDPWPLDRFAHAAAAAGLQWLGESDPSQNLPRGLSAETLAALQPLAGNPLAYQMAADAAAGRTFRSGVLCRSDAPLQRVDTRVVFEFSLHAGSAPQQADDRALHAAVNAFAPSCVSIEHIAESFPDKPQLARQVLKGIHAGWLKPRIEPLHVSSEPSEKPRLNAFRKLCAVEGLPIPDAFHVPCAFSKAHYNILRQIDGTNDIDTLRQFAREHYPDLNFDAWLIHLTRRGLFD